MRLSGFVDETSSPVKTLSQFFKGNANKPEDDDDIRIVDENVKDDGVSDSDEGSSLHDDVETQQSHKLDDAENG